MSDDSKTCPKCGRPIQPNRYMTLQELRDIGEGRPVRGVQYSAPPGLEGVKYAGPPGPPHDPPNVPKVYEYLGFGHPPMDKKSLKQRLTPQEVMSTPASAREDVRELIAGMLPGDELWTYDNMGFMGMLSGAQGLWVIRNGNVVGNVTFLQS